MLKALIKACYLFFPLPCIVVILHHLSGQVGDQTESQMKTVLSPAIEVLNGQLCVNWLNAMRT